MGDTNYNYTLTLNYDNAYMGSIDDIDGAGAAITQDPELDDKWYFVPAVHNASGKTFTASGFTDFGRFALTTADRPLPVELCLLMPKRGK
ncbi:hypothetical protein GCM10009122_23820 [Fulvivirga kasyanovii]|uniref:Uncharacterized protein n=1 Tax=Fulvivirga kasyanovii TaxID=396812 RepID=A0ABW9RJG4_9BACT|nr:hypothetical protein [Fulvivirga kasyanovii]MTI23568.1 hypothetical protein [Fulvivirga kasyanovii]